MSMIGAGGLSLLPQSPPQLSKSKDGGKEDADSAVGEGVLSRRPSSVGQEDGKMEGRKDGRMTSRTGGRFGSEVRVLSFGSGLCRRIVRRLEDVQYYTSRNRRWLQMSGTESHRPKDSFVVVWRVGDGTKADKECGNGIGRNVAGAGWIRGERRSAGARGKRVCIRSIYSVIATT
jgi:hypothetical protein